MKVAITKIQQKHNIVSRNLLMTSGENSTCIAWQEALLQMEYFLPYDELIKAANYLDELVRQGRYRNRQLVIPEFYKTCKSSPDKKGAEQ